MSAKFAPGDRIRFRHLDGTIADDVVRKTFLAEILLRPYAPNMLAPALALTNHSWCFEKDVVSFRRQGTLTRSEVATIKASSESLNVLAKRYGVTKQGIAYHKNKEAA